MKFKPFIGLLILLCCGWSSVGAAHQPPECPLLLYAIPATGVTAQADIDVVLYVNNVYTSVWDFHQHSASDFLYGTSHDDETQFTLAHVDDSQLPSFYDGWLAPYTFYNKDTVVDAGEWTLTDDEGDLGVYHVFPAIEESLIATAVFEGKVEDRKMYEDDTRDVQLNGSLYGTVTIPASWKAWYPALDNDMLFVVRLSLTEAPDLDALRVTDMVINSRSGTIPVMKVRNDCWSGPNIDWMHASTLYGVIWPLGADPHQISMRFEQDLETFQQEALELIPPQSEDTKSGCAATSYPSAFLGHIALLGLLMWKRRRP